MKFIRDHFAKDQPFETSFFRLPKFSLGFLGYWPENKITAKLIILISVNFSILAYTTFSEFAYGFLHFNQPLLALEAICPPLTKIITLLKLFMFLCYRKPLKKLLNRMKTILQKETQSDENKLEIYKTKAKTATILSTFVWCFGNTTSTFYISRPLVTNLLQYFSGEKITKQFPFTLAIPKFAFDFPYYPFLYVINSYSGVITVFGFGGCDGTYFTFCTYISVLFRIVQNDLQNILNDFKVFPTGEHLTDKQNDEIFLKLRNIIIRHNEIMSLAEEFISTFTIMIMGHFVSASLVICISCIELLLATGFNYFLYIAYNAAALTQLLIYCIGGTYVFENSTQLAETSYFLQWYVCDKRIKNMILFIMTRSQRGTPIRVPFFAPTLHAFGTILSTAGSYIALLKTIL